MSLNEDRRLSPVRGESLQFGEAAMPNAPLAGGASKLDLDEAPGTPTQSGVSPQTLVVETDQPTVKADVTERQAVEVRPMRYVLFIGLGLAIVAMLVAWLIFR